MSSLYFRIERIEQKETSAFAEVFQMKIYVCGLVSECDFSGFVIHGINDSE